MFRKDKIPIPVSDFLKSHNRQTLICKQGKALTHGDMLREFYNECEKANQDVVKMLKTAVPMKPDAIETDKESDLICMRCYAYLNKDCFIVGTVTFVKIGTFFGRAKFMQISKKGRMIYKNIPDYISHSYHGEHEKIFLTEKCMRYKDFCYKV